MSTVVRMPEVLAGVTEAAISSWLVSEGQQVAVGTPLAEVETEKAVVEYAAEVAGTVLQLVADAGTTIAVGDPIAVVGEPGEQVPDGAAGAPKASAPHHGVPQDAAAEDASDDRPGAARESPRERLFASPLVRRLARERRVDLSDVTGTGPNGRIVRRDLDALPAVAVVTTMAAAAPPAAAVAPSGAASVTEVPLTPMRRAIARRLTESASTVPHFYLQARCRIDKLLALRAEINQSSAIRVSVNDLVLKAVAGALREVPEANATWGETVIHRHETVDVAVAVAIEGGLVTPVLRGVDRLTLTEVSTAVADLAERSRAARLRQEELEGGSFTVSNLGMYGVTAFAAIINPPHAGILAVGLGRQEAVVTDGELGVATVMTVTLSADHRVIDGAVGARWLAAFERRIESPVTMLA